MRTCGLLLSHLCGHGLLLASHPGASHAVTALLEEVLALLLLPRSPYAEWLSAAMGQSVPGQQASSGSPRGPCHAGFHEPLCEFEMRRFGS